MFKNLSIKFIPVIVLVTVLFLEADFRVYAQTDESVQQDAAASYNPIKTGGEFDAAKELEGEGWLRKVPFVGNWVVDRILGEAIKAETSDETADLRSGIGQQEWTYDNPLKRSLCNIGAIPCRPQSPAVPKQPEKVPDSVDSSVGKPSVDISKEALDKSRIELEKIKEEDRRKEWQAQQWFGCRNWGISCPTYVPQADEPFDIAKIPGDSQSGRPLWEGATDGAAEDRVSDALNDGGQGFFIRTKDYLNSIWNDLGGGLSDAEKALIKKKADADALRKYPNIDIGDGGGLDPENPDYNPVVDPIVDLGKVLNDTLKVTFEECAKNPSRSECLQLKQPPKPPIDDDFDLESEDFLPPPAEPEEDSDVAPPPPPDYDINDPFSDTWSDAVAPTESLSSCSLAYNAALAAFDICYNNCGNSANRDSCLLLCPSRPTPCAAGQ